MVSIIARPTNSVRDRVPAASGWRAMASMAAATERPSASAGPIDPTAIATAAQMMETSLASMETSLGIGGVADGGADEDGCEHAEDVGLHEAHQDFECHQ